MFVVGGFAIGQNEHRPTCQVRLHLARHPRRCTDGVCTGAIPTEQIDWHIIREHVHYVHGVRFHAGTLLYTSARHLLLAVRACVAYCASPV